MHDDEGDTLLSLMAGLETRVSALATKPIQEIVRPPDPVPPPVTVAALPGPTTPVVHEPVPAPILTTVETVSLEPQPPLSEHPMVRNLLMMLPYDAQVLLGNVLASSGLTVKRAIILSAILLIAGMATGYIAVPQSMIERLQTSYKGFACPVPSTIPATTPIATPTQ